MSTSLPHNRPVCAICMSWLALTLLASPANAEIYACPGKRGAVTYQNFPCAYSSLGSMPSRATTGNDAPVKSAVATTTAESRGANAPRTSSAHEAVPVRNAATGEMRVGMSADDVRKMWGEPEEIVQEELRKGRIEIWNYKDGRSVQIDRKRRVVNMQL